MQWKWLTTDCIFLSITWLLIIEWTLPFGIKATWLINYVTQNKLIQLWRHLLTTGRREESQAIFSKSEVARTKEQGIGNQVLKRLKGACNLHDVLRNQFHWFTTLKQTGKQDYHPFLSAQSVNEASPAVCFKHGWNLNTHERMFPLHGFDQYLGYRQIKVTKHCWDMTEYANKFYTSQIALMLFWLINGAATFKKYMKRILKGVSLAGISLDDIAIFCKDLPGLITRGEKSKTNVSCRSTLDT